MKVIPLTRGKIATVDDADYEALICHKWMAHTDGRNWYACRTKHKIKMHRVLMNAPATFQVDHINGDGLDNRRHNLRLVTNKQNCWNQRKKGGMSKYKGVCWYKDHGKWAASITQHSKRIFLGYFETEEAAGRAYDQAAHKLFGQFARPNFSFLTTA